MSPVAFLNSIEIELKEDAAAGMNGAINTAGLTNGPITGAHIAPNRSLKNCSSNLAKSEKRKPVRQPNKKSLR